MPESIPKRKSVYFHEKTNTLQKRGFILTEYYTLSLLKCQLKIKNERIKIMTENNITREDNQSPVTYGTKEIAKILHCSVPTAREIMRRKDFPLLKIGKNFRVYRYSFIKWMDCSGKNY